MRKIVMIEGEVADLRDINLIYPSDYERFEGKDNYKHRLEFNFTDGYRIGYVFHEHTSRRQIINMLRDMATDMERVENDFLYFNKGLNHGD